MLVRVKDREFDLLGSPPNREQWTGPFSFALLADPQVCLSFTFSNDYHRLQDLPFISEKMA